MRIFAGALVVASIAWPIVLGTAVAARVHDSASRVAYVTYVACSNICHQLPERSFRTAGVTWPVCARCSGLYLSAPIGAVLAWRRRRRGPRSAAKNLWLLAVMSIPTFVTLAIEWSGWGSPSGVMRAAAALPLGAAIAYVLVREVADVTEIDTRRRVDSIG